MSPHDKPLVWLHGEVKSPPFSQGARIEVGVLLRLLQRGASLRMPASRPMPTIGPRCHELRVSDGPLNWRIVYRVDSDAILILAVFPKKTSQTPQNIIAACRLRQRRYEQSSED